MNAHPEACDPSLVERYLADSLDAKTEAGFHSHLKNCNVCRDRIQLAAADLSSWSEAEEFLKDQPFDAVSLSTSSFALHEEQHANHRKASASVEVARGDDVDARSDLFSPGSVMYAMCTGRPPFRAETSFGILRRITDTEPRPIREVNPNIPEWLDRIIQRLLAKSLDDRIQNASHISKLFEQCLAHVQQPTIIELPEECRPIVRVVKFSLQSWRGRTAMIVIGLLAVAGIFSVSQWTFNQPERISARFFAAKTTRKQPGG